MDQAHPGDLRRRRWSSAVVVYALIPAPVGVDIATIDRGPLEVTVDEEGVAQIRDVFRVSAPIAGRLNRVPVHVGDAVAADGPAVAAIQPAEPSLLDARTRRELQAAADAARAAVGLAEAQVTSAEASERLAQSDLERAEQLAEKGAISARALEKAITDVDTAKAAVAAGQGQPGAPAERAGQRRGASHPAGRLGRRQRQGRLLRAGDVADRRRRAQAPGGERAGGRRRRRR